MRSEKDGGVDSARQVVSEPASRGRYEPPRVVKSRQLTEVTGQGAVVPSGAPAPTPQ